MISIRHFYIDQVAVLYGVFIWRIMFLIHADDKQISWFSFDPEFHIEREQMCCYLTRTTKRTHEIVKENLHETPTYGGWVEAKGPRYCPAIEDKVSSVF